MALPPIRTFKPFKTTGTLHCSFMLTNWFSPFIHHLCLFLSLSRLNVLIHFSHKTRWLTGGLWTHITSFLDTINTLRPPNSSRSSSLIPVIFTDNVNKIFLYHIFPSFSRTTPRPRLRKPDKNTCFGNLVSDILVRWPSHSKCFNFTLQDTSIVSPHLLLTCAIVMCWDHCCLFDIPRIILTHLWWKVFSFL